MQKSYGQLGQDLIALEFFHLYPASHEFFLDVGAFDGIGLSNTRLLFEKDWSGICIEPVMKNYKKLETLYANTNVITVRAAATDYEGEMELNVATIPWVKDWGSDVSSPTSDAVERWPDYNWEKETVTATTIDRILEKNNVARVDFVSIDVEGHEMSVLRGFNLEKYKPSLLVIEYSTPEEWKQLINHMFLHGYAAWIDNGQDIFFVPSSALKNWKVFLFGVYQRFRSGRLRIYIARLVRHLSK